MFSSETTDSLIKMLDDLLKKWHDDIRSEYRGGGNSKDNLKIVMLKAEINSRTK